MRKYVFLIIILFTTKKNLSQCLNDSIFHTDSIGTYKDKLFFPLIIRIGSDTVWISSSVNTKENVFIFKIIEKQICKWNADFSQGYTTYKLATINEIQIKYPLMKINYSDERKRIIELLYPGSEERVLTIIK